MIQERFNPNEIVGYVLKIELIYAKPKIWREVEVPVSMTLTRFHELIQICMGWENYHLHQFISNGTYYGIPDENFEDDDIVFEGGHIISEFFHRKGSKLIYEYDFGDGWEHSIVCKKVLRRKDRDFIKPLAIDGEKACPPEDCGGVPGYEHLREVMSDSKHEEHDSMSEWLGGSFAPDEFDLKEINIDLEDEFTE